MKIVKAPILGTLLVGIAISLVVGHLLGQGDSRVVDAAIIVGFVGTLLR